MADVASTLAAWSATTNSNSPQGTTTIGTSLDENIREVQGVIVRGLSNKGSDIASASTTDIGAVEGLFHDVTGATTITGFGTVRAGIWKILKFEGALTLTHNATSLVLPGGANITTADGDIAVFISEGAGNWRCVSYFKATGKSIINTANTQPTRQIFTSGSGTYTTPTGATRLLVRMVGGGSGGGGGGGGSASSAAGDTTFSTLTAGGGGAAGGANGVGAAGGTATGGDINIPGGGGGGGSASISATISSPGGIGGSSAFGGGGKSSYNAAGTAAATNSGAGGGGGGSANGASTASGGGGGSGGYVEKLITSPSASYSYGVGAGSSGGTSGATGFNGGAGAAGIIIVDEFYD